MIDLVLRRELQRLAGRARAATSRVTPAPCVRVIVTASRDVSDVVGSLGGSIVADVGGRVLAARIPAPSVGRLATQPGVQGLFALESGHPTLDLGQFRAILVATARHDQFTGDAAWAPGFGAGKVDALAAVSAVPRKPVDTATPTATVTPTATATPTPTSTATPTITRTATSSLTARSTSSRRSARRCKKGYKLVKGRCRRVRKKA